jgi:23S rRNA (uracil-5-)-methyltransferase RumA
MTGELRAGARIEVRADALDARGAGVGPAGAVRVHVAGLLPGERAEVEIEHVSPHRGADGRSDVWARALAMADRSPDRVEPACPAYGDCGGCPLQHLAYPAQLRWKREQVAAALEGLGGPAVDACVPSPRLLGYRNQGKYVYGPAAGPPTLGAYAPRSHRLVGLLGCRVVEPVIDEVATALGGLLARAGVPAFDERRRTGLLRGCVLRSNARGEVLVALVTARQPWPEGPRLAEALRAADPRVVGVVQNVNTGAGNVIFGDQDTTLAGQPHLAETLSGVTVRVGARAFLQLNRDVAAAIYARVAEAARSLGTIERMVELYAGVGAMSLGAARLAAEAIAIEENPEATAAGAAAAREAGLASLRFVTADAAGGLRGIDRADLVVLNPPRAGVDAAVAAAVPALGARLGAYVSCDAGSLARDLGRMSAAGLRPLAITPFDMLPHTPHVEVLVLLGR